MTFHATVFIALLLIGFGPAGQRAQARAEGAAHHVQAAGERAPGSFDHGASLRAQRTRHAALVRQQVARGLVDPLTIELSADDHEALEQADAGDGRLRVGVAKQVGVAVDFGDLAGRRVPATAEARALGAVRGTGDGGWVWTGAVHSAGAAALRVHLTNVALPPGATLHVYNETGQVRGPYTGAGPLGTGEFWTHTVAGPTLILQIAAPAGGRGGAVGGATFDLAAVGHLGPRFPLGVVPAGEAGSDLCGFNEPCIRNASCASVPSAIDPARDAVALIEFVSGAFLYTCSGGLVADTDTTTQVPYFLTANHCLKRQREAESLEAFFQFSIPCGGICFDPDGVVPSTLGADLVASASAADYTLLRLHQAPPAGSMFLGWSSAPVAFADGTALFRISHPAGAPQAFSQHVVDTGRPTCRSWPRGDRIYSSDVVGGTEGGSSGSPVLNAAGQIVGQLSGACGYNVGDPCDAVSNATVDGAFAAYFTEVAAILDPPASGGTTTTTLAPASTTTTTVSSTTTSTTLGGSCGLPGDSCDTASDCCSATCRGKPGSRSCK